MKETLRTSLWCLFVALALNVAFTHAQALAPSSLNALWLQINTVSNPGDPRNTVIITSARPVVQQLKENRWQIIFVP